MQNRDGGWAAYDVDIDNQVLTKLPFADHNAMLDPSCADITARVLELLGTVGYRDDHPSIAPRPGLPVGHPGAGGLLVWPLGGQLHLRHLAGLAGPGRSRFPMDHPRDPQGRGLARVDPATLGRLGRDLPELRRPQLKGTGEPTPSQTAWATLGLVAAGRAAVRPSAAASITSSSPAARRLLGRGPFTGTGFPRVFYLRYHYYRVYFPLMAIARYQAAIERDASRSPGAGEPDPGPAFVAES